MVLFNSGGEWGEQSATTAPAPFIRRPSTHELDLAIFPNPGKTFATDLGRRGRGLQAPTSPASQPSSEPALQRAPHLRTTCRCCRLVFAISELCACPTSENCSVQETVI